MNTELKRVIPKLVCGNETATAFLISNDIAITATHALIDFFDKKEQVKLYFRLDNESKEIDAEPIILDGETKNQQIIALRLSEALNCVTPLKCIDYKFNCSLNCRTFGYPPVRSEVGTFIDLQVKHEVRAEDYRSLNSNWNIDLSKNDDIKNYEGVSGAPLIINDCAVAVLLKQVKENGEASRLSAVSLYLYKEYLNRIGIDILGKKNDLFYEPYLIMLQRCQHRFKIPRFLR